MNLSIIIPCKSYDDPDLKLLLKDIYEQHFLGTKEVLVITDGNSEEAKAIGILRARGDILGFFCADNRIRHPRFLEQMYLHASIPDVTGAYPAYYDYVQNDTALSRYFALMGANDPLCWWLGKADRSPHDEKAFTGFKVFLNSIPSIGDNGFFVKRSALDKVRIDPSTHFPMDLCEDLRRVDENTYYVTDKVALWHRTGERFFDYFKRRYVYARDLYFRRREKRRWHMVEQKDWPQVISFSVLSLLFLPHLWTSYTSYKKVPDAAWFLHAPVCFILTVLYAALFIQCRLESLLSSRLWTDGTVSKMFSPVCALKPENQTRSFLSNRKETLRG